MKLFKISLLALMCFVVCSCEKSTRPKRELMVNDQLLYVGQKLAKKHKLSFSGAHEHYNSWTQKENINAGFQVFRKLTKQEARAILVDCIETFDRETNHNKKLQNYLPEGGYPIGGFSIDIIIQPNNQRSYHPNLGIVSIYKNKISYETYDPDAEMLATKTEEVETFEVAQHIVQHQHASLRES